MKTTYLVKWRCPRCNHVEGQPPRVRQVDHLCGLGKHRVELVREDDDDA